MAKNIRLNTWLMLFKYEKLDDLIPYLDRNLQILNKHKHINEACGNLESFKRYEEIVWRMKNKKSFFALYWDVIAFLICSIILVLLVGNFVYTKSDLKGGECVLSKPILFQLSTLPREDCGMCAGLTQVARLKHIDRYEFVQKYAYAGGPIIVEDAAQNWPALKMLNYDFIRDLYLNQGTNNTFEFISYNSKAKSLHEFFAMEPTEANSTEWYIGWANYDNDVSRNLSELYERPHFLPPHETGIRKLDWIYMGHPGHGAHIHIDRVTYPSWQAQIRGSKKWTFRPPAECLRQCAWSLEADVYPGDVIVFESNRWFHATRVLGTEMSLSIGSEFG